jgi:putative tryptophan/tyrosine transport system substrate-binding protein
MHRRAFIRTVLAGFLGLSVTSRAQQPAKVARIGFLGANSASSWASRLESFRLGLRELGYVEGKNIVIEFRWADEQYDRLPALAAELVRLKVDILVTYGTPGTLAAKRATTTIPIVMVHAGDAIITGLVANLARPGENITGSTFFVPELMAKRLELLKDAIPRITQVATLVKPDNPLLRTPPEALHMAAKSLKIELQQFEARGPKEFEATFSAIAERRVDAVAILDDAVFIANARALANLAVKQRLPSAGFDELAEAGGLIGYGVDFLPMYRRAAVFVDKILKGAKPGDLSIEQATKFRLVINVKTSNALGLTIPQSLLLRADEVIE